MTLKINDLERFVKQFKQNGFEEVSDHQMDYAIGREFGVSIHTRKNIKHTLREFGFIEIMPFGWKIKWKEEPKPIVHEEVKFDELFKKGGNENGI